MYAFKERLGPWGLVVYISANLELPSTEPVGVHRAGSKTWLRVPENAAPEDVEWLEFAADLVAEEIEDAHGYAPVILISVASLEVPMLDDYQEEAAAAALIFWLRSMGEIIETDVDIMFDKEANRYSFSFSGPADAK